MANAHLMTSEFYCSLCTKLKAVGKFFRHDSIFVFISDFGQEWIASGTNAIVQRLHGSFKQTTGEHGTYHVLISRRQSFLISKPKSGPKETLILVIALLKLKHQKNGRKFFQQFLITQDKNGFDYCKSSTLVFLGPSDAGNELIRTLSLTSVNSDKNEALSPPKQISTDPTSVVVAQDHVKTTEEEEATDKLLKFDGDSEQTVITSQLTDRGSRNPVGLSSATKCKTEDRAENTDPNCNLDIEQKGSQFLHPVPQASFADALKSGLSQEDGDGENGCDRKEQGTTKTPETPLSLTKRLVTAPEKATDDVAEAKFDADTTRPKFDDRSDSTLFVANIPKCFTKQYLIFLFKGFGRVRNVRIIDRNETMFGFLSFDSRTSVDEIVRLAGSTRSMYANGFLLKVDRYKKRVNTEPQNEK